MNDNENKNKKNHEALPDEVQTGEALPDEALENVAGGLTDVSKGLFEKDSPKPC